MTQGTDATDLTAGGVAVLNVGAGDVRLSFDPANPAERIRAARIVKDMLRRGYALLVEVERDGVRAFERALEFDEARCEYIIADFDPTAAAAEEETPRGNSNTSAEATPAEAPIARKRGRPRKAVSAGAARAVAVAPSAGG